MSEQSEPTPETNPWLSQTIVQKLLAVGESLVTAQSLLARLDDKYKPQLDSAANAWEFGARWAPLRAKLMAEASGQKVEPEPETKPESQSSIDDQPEAEADVFSEDLI